MRKVRAEIPAGSLCHADRVLAEVGVDLHPDSVELRDAIARAIYSAYQSGYETGRAYQRQYARKRKKAA